MEYSIYVNQKAAVEWELTMGEALFFSYLINSSGWMAVNPDNPDYKWVSSGKLAKELPMVCAHEGSARRHMKSLEDKGVIHRELIGNKSYFKITSKGMLWRSDTLVDPNESERLGGEPKRIGSGNPNESVRVDPNESVRLSDTPLSGKPVKGKNRKKLPPDFVEMVTDLHAEILPELESVVIWKDDQTRARYLMKIWQNTEFDTHTPEFWKSYFLFVRDNDWWMGRSESRSGKPFKASFEFLIHPQRFVTIVEGCLNQERRGAA